MAARRLHQRFGRLRAKLDLEHVRLHDLHHFVASVLIDGGIPISTVSQRLGHSQMSTTLNIYTHAMPATDQKAADYLGTSSADGSHPELTKPDATLSRHSPRTNRRAHICRFPCGNLPGRRPGDRPWWTGWTIPASDGRSGVLHGLVRHGEQHRSPTHPHRRTGRQAPRFRHWIGAVLGAVARDQRSPDEPMLTALVVHADGTIGPGYAVPVGERDGVVPAHLEQHAAAERLACHRYFGADLPPDGGKPIFTAQVAAKRERGGEP